MPIATMLLSEIVDPKRRGLFKNITYLGALAGLLNIEFDVITGMVATQYKGMDALIEPNIRALELGRNYALEYFAAPLPLQVKRSDVVGDRIMIEGNDAAGLGGVYGGATVCAWYQITPSTSVAESFENQCKKLRVDPQNGEKNYAFLRCALVYGYQWPGQIANV